MPTFTCTACWAWVLKLKIAPMGVSVETLASEAALRALPVQV
jgi:hypothetical protein